MKNIVYRLLPAILMALLTGPVQADEAPGLPPQASQEPQQQAPDPADRMNLDGWINKINYTKSEFFMRDYRGFEKKVKVKEGSINDFKLGDKVKVKIRYDNRVAEMIQKVG